jgi:hypothetical protein
MKTEAQTMRYPLSPYLSAIVFLSVASGSIAATAMETLSTRLSANHVYESGQVYDVMRSPDGQRIQLNDLVLVENDAPGAGKSEKGAHNEALHAGVQVKKVLHLEDPSAETAHVVLYMEPKTPTPAPYHLLVNGHHVEGAPQSWHERVWWWIPIPVEFLVKGSNEVVVVCDAPEGEGYDLLFARADEYGRGGGAFSYRGHTGLLTSGFVPVPDSGILEGLVPIQVGESSARSTDGGTNWNQARLGPDADTLGEYVIRLNLQRYHPSGHVDSRPVDLWANSAENGIVPRSQTRDLRLEGLGNCPQGTSLHWAVRYANTPDPTSDSWGDFRTIGQGEKLTESLPETDQRYIQVRVTLQTGNPLQTPAFQEFRITRVVQQEEPKAATYYVRNSVNPPLDYPSYPMYFETAKAPQLDAIRKALPADLLVGDSHGQFAEINQIRHHVSQLWYHGSPHPEYPEWNALDILMRKNRYGYGGMCIQFTIVFVQALQSLGYQARHVNVFNHEMPEVYVDELEKWVVVDAESVFDSYEFNTETGLPLSALEQHEYFLDRYGFTAENPIPWASPDPWCNWPSTGQPETPQPLEISTFTDWINDPDPVRRPPQHNLVGFLRLIPRNDFLSRPTPRPVAQGTTYWPWSGYLNWYDPATPRKLQYALHSDRVADFYPTLNRVHFTATHGDGEGLVDIQMTTQTPNLDSYEISINGSGWNDNPAEFTWPLFPGALNRLEMRIRNEFGLRGKPSALEIFYHYREPYKPKATP